MLIIQFVTVASALALAPTAVVARQGAAAFVTVNSIDVCPKKVAQEIINPGPKVVTTPYTCDQVKLGHGLDVSYYNFDIEPLTKDTFTARLSRSLTTKVAWASLLYGSPSRAHLRTSASLNTTSATK